MPRKLVYASADGWAAIWIDGWLWAEGHRIGFHDWLELIAEEEGPFEVWNHAESSWFYDMVDEHGCAVNPLPENFDA